LCRRLPHRGAVQIEMPSTQHAAMAMVKKSKKEVKMEKVEDHPTPNQPAKALVKAERTTTPPLGQPVTAIPDPAWTVQDTLWLLNESAGSETYVTRGIYIGTGVRVALKRAAEKASAATRSSLLQERDLLQSVRHPCIVELLASYCEGEADILVLPEADFDLQTFLRRRTCYRISDGLARKCAIDVFNGLQALHAREIAHGDLKTNHVLVFLSTHEDDGDLTATFKLTDLRRAHSLSRAAGQPPSPWSSFSAPEVVFASEAASWAVAASDVWSGGAVMFEAVIGEPFVGENCAVTACTRHGVLSALLKRLGPVPEALDLGEYYGEASAACFETIATTWDLWPGEPLNVSEETVPSGGWATLRAALQWDPSARPAAGDVVRGPWVLGEPAAGDDLRNKIAPAPKRFRLKVKNAGATSHRRAGSQRRRRLVASAAPRGADRRGAGRPGLTTGTDGNETCYDL